ncbi:Na+/H+ antiporter NhaA [Pseudomonas syringae]|uniref:Na(+)/H(+) antiporter NhaA n=2 Tax=Pseudomonas syringae TaxID=317 RepID=A0AB74A615_PSESX|nr:Na+/H+ antiporter NhaA [Pseudomonas syringae]ALU61562.1 sodium:proton antiporter [Pseudomonas syringae pv. lapsa]KPX66031.1 Na antiporter NhaA [Pseudomonas syringae pv. lapsa]MBS7424876.1 Na+/H+ antiporter NhaA [Pseudomonas syringae]MBS7430881.1 Na+/H+ antiporter NhaA [Pseudomonas syringae]MCF5649996.1 Na+/H+ antiporter NhaA [Pseudomonas syringae]
MPENQQPPTSIPRPQQLAEKALSALERFSHIEAVSGIALLIAAITALIWANSLYAESYEHLLHTQISIGFGDFSIARSFHFLINDGLMTIFFLVVGAEIRQEIHNGALANFKMALLPMGAAFGGVVVPAAIYIAVNHGTDASDGWAVPTATDIAFAVGVLALLGKSIPGGVRVLLLALAIIDDIVAILIIAVFYTTSLDYSGIVIAIAGMLMVLLFQRMGIGKMPPYVLPGAIIWYGLYKTGVHPTLAGVILGLMSPVRSMPMRERPLEAIQKSFHELVERFSGNAAEPTSVSKPLKVIRQAEREMLTPVQRIQAALHPWVAFAIMPLFALANAGVNFGGANLENVLSQHVFAAIIAALVVGKPMGVILASFLLVKSGLCKLPSDVSWTGVILVGLLAGIGFTMSIFIATLGFNDEGLLAASKLSVLCASATAAALGLGWGVIRRSSLLGMK